MIPNGEGWYYLTVKKLSVLLRGITSKYHDDFCYLSCLYYFATENKFEPHKKVCLNKDYSNVVMLFDSTKILEFNQYQKCDKAPFVIYVDLECLVEKIDGCKNNPENSSKTKVSKHIPSGFSMSTISSFKNIKNKYDVYRN